jgi:hypothetical protein
MGKHLMMSETLLTILILACRQTECSGRWWSACQVCTNVATSS